MTSFCKQFEKFVSNYEGEGASLVYGRGMYEAIIVTYNLKYPFIFNRYMSNVQ